MVGHYICRVRVSKNFKLRFLSSKKQKKRSLTAREAADVFCDSNATLAQIGANVLKYCASKWWKRYRSFVITSLYKMYENSIHNLFSQTRKIAPHIENSIFSFSSCLLSNSRMKTQSTQTQFKCNQLGLETSEWNILILEYQAFAPDEILTLRGENFAGRKIKKIKKCLQFFSKFLFWKIKNFRDKLELPVKMLFAIF